MARILVHFHATLPTITGNCTTNTHHPDCSKFGLTTTNEVACNKQNANTPKGRPCRCEHKCLSRGLAPSYQTMSKCGSFPVRSDLNGFQGSESLRKVAPDQQKRGNKPRVRHKFDCLRSR